MVEETYCGLLLVCKAAIVVSESSALPGFLHNTQIGIKTGLFSDQVMAIGTYCSFIILLSVALQNRTHRWEHLWIIRDYDLDPVEARLAYRALSKSSELRPMLVLVLLTILPTKPLSFIWS